MESDRFEASTLADELKRMDVTMVPLTTRAVTGACADFHDRVTEVDADGGYAPRIRIRPDSALDIAAEIVSARRIGDAWAWSRRGPSSGGTIAALEAATLAVYAAHHQPAPPAAPAIY